MAFAKNVFIAKNGIQQEYLTRYLLRIIGLYKTRSYFQGERILL